jgi:uncharacterized Zn-finger protein
MQSKAGTTNRKQQSENEAVCDGGGGALGHPKIYLPFGNKTEVICYYCGKRFEKKTDS